MVVPEVEDLERRYPTEGLEALQLQLLDKHWDEHLEAEERWSGQASH